MFSFLILAIVNVETEVLWILGRAAESTTVFESACDRCYVFVDWYPTPAPAKPSQDDLSLFTIATVLRSCAGVTKQAFLGRARLRVKSALWSHVYIVIVIEDPSLADPPPKLHATMRAALWSHV